MNRVWYASGNNLESADTIHQILQFGSLDDIRFLKKSLGENAIKKAFLEYPKKIYTPSTLHFTKNFILHIPTSIDDGRYLKDTPRHTR